MEKRSEHLELIRAMLQNRTILEAKPSKVVKSAPNSAKNQKSPRGPSGGSKTMNVLRMAASTLPHILNYEHLEVLKRRRGRWIVTWPLFRALLGAHNSWAGPIDRDLRALER